MGATTFGFGVGALGNSLFGASGCGTGAGAGAGLSIGGAIFRNTLGSTFTGACGAGARCGVGFNDSSAPGGNSTVKGLVIDHFGKARHRLLYCRACKARFSEFKGTPFFNSRLPHEKVLAVLEHLADGCGVRQTARLVGVGKNTVNRLALLAGSHARQLHDELAGFSPLDHPGATR